MNPNVIYTTDDLSQENIKYFHYWDKVKACKPELQLIAFTIAKDLDLKEFKTFYEERQNWLQIAVHCYDHEKPQEGWREDQREYIERARDILKPYLPTKYLYRPPGFRFLPKTEKILKELGFAGIAHQQFIKYFETGEKVPILNTHCTENLYHNAIGQIWQNL